MEAPETIPEEPEGEATTTNRSAAAEGIAVIYYSSQILLPVV